VKITLLSAGAERAISGLGVGGVGSCIPERAAVRGTVSYRASGVAGSLGRALRKRDMKLPFFTPAEDGGLGCLFVGVAGESRPGLARPLGRGEPARAYSSIPGGFPRRVPRNLKKPLPGRGESAGGVLSMPGDWSGTASMLVDAYSSFGVDICRMSIGLRDSVPFSWNFGTEGCLRSAAVASSARRLTSIASWKGSIACCGVRLGEGDADVCRLDGVPTGSGRRLEYEG
jgi:hypothetical protein